MIRPGFPNRNQIRQGSFGTLHELERYHKGASKSPVIDIKNTSNMYRKGHNRVYIATSLDGYIADADGGVGFLDSFPMPENDDMGFTEFMGRTEAILMGRKSFETVLGFGVAWPYVKPVFVWTQTLQEIPESLAGKVTLVSGETIEVLERIHKEGYSELYIDGGLTIQSFLKHDLIDEITITTIPVLIGRGIPLFGPLNGILTFGCVKSKSFGNGLSQNVYVRSRTDGLS